MGITSSSKTLSATTIPCGGSFDVTLALKAEPDIMSNPTDIVLILDRSGSMQDSLDSLKEAAKLFIDIIDESTDGAQDGQIGGGSHIGIVSFADTATQDTQLTTSVAALKAAVDALSAGGTTNHADAFTKALALFDSSSSNAKVMVMFTDGVTTAGGPPNPVATLAKSQGVIIYAIGLEGNGGIDEQALRDWASDPDADFVSIAPSDEELAELFEDLARSITRPGATDIELLETVEDCFEITAVATPGKGTATQTGARTLRWTIPELGATQREEATLTFTLRHNGVCSGPLAVDASIVYTDNEGNQVDFDDPVIEVDCGGDVTPEACPEPVEITIEGCEDSLEFHAGDLELESLGRILQISVRLRHICPGRRVALAVVLTELDDKDREEKRGLKTLLIPAHHQSGCRDVTVRCVKFVLPEALDPEGGEGICNDRRFRARLFANYIDNDFACCDLTL